LYRLSKMERICQHALLWVGHRGFVTETDAVSRTASVQGTLTAQKDHQV
jgi:hypothetical protein